MTLIILEADLVKHGKNAVITEKNTPIEKKNQLLKIEELTRSRDEVLMTLAVDNGAEHLERQVEKIQALNTEIKERKEEIQWMGISL